MEVKPNGIYCGDSAEVLKHIDDETIDLTVTSPPYDNLREYDGFILDWRTIIDQLYRVTKPGGVVVWVVADQTVDGGETGTSFRQALYAMDQGFNNETMIYTVYGTGAKGSNYYYWQAFEYMFVWVKGYPKTSNRIADVKNKYGGRIRRKNSEDSVAQKNKSRMLNRTIVSPEYGMRTNVWRYAVGVDNRVGHHPAPFPLALAKDHIITWTNPDEIVLDPFIGSGTTAVAAKELGRRYIGIDVSEKYCANARKRLEWTNPPLLAI